jgi:hypothetical protein
MKNFKRIKNDLKAISKKYELKNQAYFYISHGNQNKNLHGIKSNLPKNQYLANDFANIVRKNEIKFPLETYTYSSKQELVKEIVAQNKNILGLIKIHSKLFLNKQTLNSYNFKTTAIYSKVNGMYLNVVKLTIFLKHLNKTTVKVA